MQGFIALLWNVQHGTKLPVPKPNRVSFAASEADAGFYQALGFITLGGRAVRIDRLDELAGELAKGRDIPMKALTKALTCTPKEAQAVIAALRERPKRATPDHRFRQKPFAVLGDAVANSCRTNLADLLQFRCRLLVDRWPR